MQMIEVKLFQKNFKFTHVNWAMCLYRKDRIIQNQKFFNYQKKELRYPGFSLKSKWLG